MRCMVIVKADKNSEAGLLPTKKTKETFAAMGKFNEELIRGGVMLAGEGLQPSSKGKRVRFSGKQRTVIDGPFAETKELIGGFWLWQGWNGSSEPRSTEGLRWRSARCTKCRIFLQMSFLLRKRHASRR